MIHVKVPATTANMGSGFDSIGMALEIYNNVWIEEIESGLIIESKNGKDIPVGKDNLIYETIVNFYKENNLGEVPSIKIVQEDNIPMARGLGSSAACIVAGLLAANSLSKLNLPIDSLISMGAIIEGHPDNTTPAFTGGVTVGAINGKELEYIKINAVNLSKLKFAVLIPEFQLLTEKARGALPKEYNIKDVVFNVSRAALMVGALSCGDFSKLKVATDDKIHQPYRESIVPNMAEIFKKAEELNATAYFLSGAGPTLICISEKDEFLTNMNEYLLTLENKWSINYVKPDLIGAIVNII